jgi:hypothetical protein
VSNRNAKIAVLRKIQFWLETSYMLFVFVLMMVYLALTIRAAFFPDHCAASIGFSVCLNS